MIRASNVGDWGVGDGTTALVFRVKGAWHDVGGAGVGGLDFAVGFRLVSMILRLVLGWYHSALLFLLGRTS